MNNALQPLLTMLTLTSNAVTCRRMEGHTCPPLSHIRFDSLKLQSICIISGEMKKRETSLVYNTVLSSISIRLPADSGWKPGMLFSIDFHGNCNGIEIYFTFACVSFFITLCSHLWLFNKRSNIRPVRKKSTQILSSCEALNAFIAKRDQNDTWPFQMTLTFIFKMYILVERHCYQETQDYATIVVAAVFCGPRPHRDAWGCEIYV